jgi:hypothetical protein
LSTVREHLFSRHMDLDLHTAWVCEDDRLVVFPTYNLSGQMTGYMQYRPEGSKDVNNDPMGRYWSYRNRDLLTVWGLESWLLSDTLFVTEGIFDAARLTSLGYSAVAVLSNNPKQLMNWLRMQRRKVVSVCDHGKAGENLAKYGDHSFTTLDDLGSASDEEVQLLLEQHA